MIPVDAIAVESLLRRGLPKEEVARYLAEQSLEIIAALRESRMSIEEAEVKLFNLENYKALLKYRLPRALVRLFGWAMEFEDVADIVPGAIIDSYRAASALARRVLARPPAKPRSGRAVAIKRPAAHSTRRRGDKAVRSRD
ncbi:MAG: DUF3969 family protein [Planctomycetota bacterium]|nr:DUF3969 family protein [Planctomycetota bacterium]